VAKIPRAYCRFERFLKEPGGALFRFRRKSDYERIKSTPGLPFAPQPSRSHVLRREESGTRGRIWQ